MAAPVPINEIDLSECSELRTSVQALTEADYGTIYGPLMTKNPGVGLNVESASVYCDKACIWGKRLIMTPRSAYRKVVTTEILDTRLIGSEADTSEIRTLTQLPTKFVVNNVNTEIYLHASYCAFGCDEFEVEQSNGFTCKIYDYDQNLIFDGEIQGNGTFRINVYKDNEQAEQDFGLMWINDFNQCWEVTRIGGGLNITDDGNGNVVIA